MYRYTPGFAMLAIVAAALTSRADPPMPAQNPAEGSGGRVLEVGSADEVLPGVVRPRRSVTVGAAFDGQVLDLLVDEGERVREGQIIARLDDRVARAAAALARQEAEQHARIGRAQLALAHAERVLDRTRSLQRRGAANDEELTNAAFEVEMARTDLIEARELQAAAKLRLRQAEAQVERHLVRAPFDGVVVRLAVDDGAIVQSGDPVAMLSDLDNLSADIFLPAQAARRVERGRAYAILLDAPLEMVVWARARYVEPQIEPTSGTMRVVFDFDLPSDFAAAGVLATPADRPPSNAELARTRQGADPQGAIAIQHDEP